MKPYFWVATFLSLAPMQIAACSYGSIGIDDFDGSSSRDILIIALTPELNGGVLPALKDAADQNNIFATAILAGVSSGNLHDLVRILRAKADSGDLRAEYLISVALGDDAQMRFLLEQANNGDSCAMYEIAQKYHSGDGVPQSDTESLKWYKLSAEAGFGEAQAELGYRYLQGWRVEADRSEAIRWYQLAIDQGNPTAHYRVGELYYYENYGFPKDHQKAVEFYKVAAEGGHSNAQEKLSRMYLGGEGGLPKDYELALNWMQRSGHTLDEAMYRLAWAFFGDDDYVSAKKWMAAAAAQGSERARDDIERLDRRIRKRTTAQQRAAERASEVTPFGIIMGLIAFGIALDAMSPDQSNWSDDQRQRAYEAEQRRLQNQINTDLAIGWSAIR